MHGSRNFLQRGPGSADRRKKNLWQRFYYFLFDFNPQLIFSYTEFFLRKTIILKGSSSDRGSSWGPTFPKGGGPTFFKGKWGSTLISIETL